MKMFKILAFFISMVVFGNVFAETTAPQQAEGQTTPKCQGQMCKPCAVVEGSSGNKRNVDAPIFATPTVTPATITIDSKTSNPSDSSNTELSPTP